MRTVVPALILFSLLLASACNYPSVRAVRGGS